MGRGKQEIAQGFDGLFGARRGQSEGGSFLRLGARSPSQAQQDMATTLIERSREAGDMALLIREVRPCALLDPAEAPLLGRVVDEMADRLATAVAPAWMVKAVEMAAIMGIRSRQTSATLVQASGSKTVHIWPDGVDRPEYALKSGMLLCGKEVSFAPTVTNEGWRRQTRGSFLRASPNKPCSACERAMREHPELHPEAFEQSGRMSWSWALKGLEDRVTQGLRPEILSLVREGADEAALSERAGEQGSGGLTELLVEAATERPEWPIYRTLCTFQDAADVAVELGLGHLRDIRHPGRAELLFASWLGEDDWRELVGSAMEGGRSVGGPPSTQDDWAKALCARILAVGKERVGAAVALGDAQAI
jgi:hypothetical protein